MATMMAIPRKPVGLGPSNSVKHVKDHSVVSSMYSEPAELDVPRTNISEYSLESVPLDDNNAPQWPFKETSPPVPAKDGVGNYFVPPIPPKDAARQDSGVSSFRLAEGNFQKPEIWKRRSDRSNSELSFDDLKLSKSNGSTAGSPPRVQAPPPQRSLPPIPSEKGKTGLRKARSPPPRPPPQPDYMGAKNSKLRKKESHGSSVSPPILPGRLPTPEYQKSDKQIPETPNILSPVSPESPESPDLSPQRSPLKKLSSASLFEKASSPAIPKVRIHESIDTDFSDVVTRSRSSSDTIVVGTTDRTTFSMPQPQKANATARILTPQPSSPNEVPQPARSPPPQQGTPKSPKSPFYFPFNSAQKALAIQNRDAIVDAPAISKDHYDCYQKHRLMRPSRNDQCPVACMICKKKDTEKRWCCTWCALRVCTSCIEVLSGSGKDLKLTVEKIGKGGHGRRSGNQSDSRIGS